MHVHALLHRLDYLLDLLESQIEVGLPQIDTQIDEHDSQVPQFGAPLLLINRDVGQQSSRYVRQDMMLDDLEVGCINLLPDRYGQCLLSHILVLLDASVIGRAHW